VSVGGTLRVFGVMLQGKWERDSLEILVNAGDHRGCPFFETFPTVFLVCAPVSALALGGATLCSPVHCSDFSYSVFNNDRWHCIIGTVLNGREERRATEQ
jgi:hypothetical protein